MTALPSDPVRTPRGEQLINLLGQDPTGPPGLAAGVRAWWRAEAGPGVSLVAFLTRAGVLEPTAAALLDAAGGGYFAAPRLDDLLRPGGLERLRAAADRYLPAAPTGRTTPTPAPDPPAPPAPAGPPGVGATLGKCQLVAELGRGGFGVVYQALHATLGVPVAVKVLRRGSGGLDPGALAELKREARLLARLSHPHVVRVLDLEDAGDVPYLVLEYVDGTNLAELVRCCGVVAPDRAVGIGAAVAEALAAAHALGVVHRDVKPHNVLLTREGTPKLADLGLAAAAGTASGGSGTPLYAAPEQSLGSGGADHRSDIYSLGATLYHALTGAPPFPGDDPWDVLARHAEEAPVPPRDRNPAVPAALSDLVVRMLAKRPEDRPATALEVRDELTRSLESPAKKSGSGLWAALFRRTPG